MAGQSVNLESWEPKRYHVQQGITGNKFVSAEGVLLAFGPPTLGGFGSAAVEAATGPNFKTGAVVYPAGVVEAVSISQAKQLQRLFEIGSRRSYFIPGRTIGQVSITRTLFDGPSLMRAMYAYAETDRISKLINSNAGNFTGDAVELDAGYGNLLSNLESDLFDRPMGVMIAIVSNEGIPYGSFYLQNAYINSHQLSISATSTLIAEGVTIQYDELKPLQVLGAEESSSQSFNSSDTSAIGGAA
jgi:hypothetical protein